MNTHYETPEALRHDFHALADDARTLIRATSHLADERVAHARGRLESALARGKETWTDLQGRAAEGVQATDSCVRRHTYEAIAVVFGVGALLGYLSRRNG